MFAGIVYLLGCWGVDVDAVGTSGVNVVFGVLSSNKSSKSMLCEEIGRILGCEEDENATVFDRFRCSFVGC